MKTSAIRPCNHTRQYQIMAESHPDLNGCGITLLILGVVLTVLVAIIEAFVVTQYSSLLGTFGSFCWAILPALVFIVVSTSVVPFLRLGRKHPILVLVASMVISAVSIIYVSSNLFQIYMGGMACGASLLLACGIFTLLGTTTDLDGRPLPSADCAT